MTHTELGKADAHRSRKRYVDRHLSDVLYSTARAFAVVLVTGARQAGKSTLLRHSLNDMKGFDLDDSGIFDALRSAPVDFFKYNAPPLILDEVQKAPHIFEHMKSLVDAVGKKGMYFLTGSDQFALMEKASESLSGRVGILVLQGLSLREKVGCADTAPFVPTDAYLDTARTRRASEKEVFGTADVWNEIHRGDKPELFAERTIPWDVYYGSYVTTYLERDVRRIVNISDLGRFQQFMRIVASRTATTLNYASLAHDLGVSEPTAKKWLNVLEATNIIYLLRPYYSNLGKRETKAPKIHFLDTGLAAYLTRWTSPDTLRCGALSGNFFESFVIGEVLKSFQNFGVSAPPLYFYRDRDGNEIDLIIESDGVLYPVEIKQSSTPNIGTAQAFKVLERALLRQKAVELGKGCVVCMADRLLPLDTHTLLVPYWCL
ncbi:MAG: ATP-binding protein [Coriobacteriales bacterium]|jgi:predicted AAA+ superfamily ATPase|nr:ATP-binding protein [Coriobacteriales bacterium]